MNNKIIDTIGVVSAVLMLCFVLLAPAILSLVSSPWWLAIYPLYVVAYMTDRVGSEFIEDEEEEEV
jgi:hypothetical protein